MPCSTTRPLCKHHDAIGRADRAQAVGDDQRRAPAHQLLERVLQARLGVAVDAGGRFVEDQDRRVAVERARKGDQLALAGREVAAVLLDRGDRARPRSREQIERADAPQRLLDARAGRARSPAATFAGDRAGEQEHVLRHDRETAAAARRDRARRTSWPPTRTTPLLDLVQAEEQRGDRGLAATGRPDERDLLAAARVKLTSRSTGTPGLYSKLTWSSSSASAGSPAASRRACPAQSRSSMSSRPNTRSAPAIALCSSV